MRAGGLRLGAASPSGGGGGANRLARRCRSGGIRGLRGGIGQFVRRPPKATATAEPLDPERKDLRRARAEIEEEIERTQSELSALFAEGKVPPKASVVAEHRNRLSFLESKLKNFDQDAVQEIKVNELKRLQREKMALQKAVIAGSSLKSAKEGSDLKAEDVGKMAEAVEEENAALRSIVAIRQEELARKQETTLVQALDVENQRLHERLESLLARERALLELSHHHMRDRIVVSDEDVEREIAAGLEEGAEAVADALPDASAGDQSSDQGHGERGADQDLEEEASPPETRAQEEDPPSEEEAEEEGEGEGLAPEEPESMDSLIDRDLARLVSDYENCQATREDYEARSVRLEEFTWTRLSLATAGKGVSKAEAEIRKRMADVREATMALHSQNLIQDNWRLEGEARPESSVTFSYDATAGPLAGSEDLNLHWGCNAWSTKGFATKLSASKEEEGWYEAQITVPEGALVLDFVVESQGNYDNNLGLDFHAPVTRKEGPEAFWEKLVGVELAEEEQAQEDKRERLEQERETQESALAAKQEEVVSTHPALPKAGQIVTVSLSLAASNLPPSDHVEVEVTFNRNSHALKLPRSQMIQSARDPDLFELGFPTPSDAHMMDLKFHGSHGARDDHHGFGYHIPLHESVVAESPQHVVHVAVEMAPVAKVGGLGDVVTSIGRAVQDMGHMVEVVLPKYDTIDYENQVEGFKEIKSFEWGGCTNRVFTGLVEDLQVHFIQPGNGFFDIGMIYGADWEPIPMMDSERFGFFSKAALEFLLQSGRSPDIIHCHDWSTAITAKSYWEDYHEHGLPDSSIVFTIHNFGYGKEDVGMAAMYSQKFTTVSPTYANEIRDEHCIAPYSNKFVGILNGIDPSIWDPMDDEFLPVSYSSSNAGEGKAGAKRALRERVGLRNDDVPLVGIVSRLTAQKGVHLMEHAIWTALERGCQVIVLGSAFDPEMQQHWNELELRLRHQYHDLAKLIFAYDEPLSHLIYAGADMILVPSMFEPCGLTQMIAMRYGSVPVVRQTGGLRDTVFDVDHDQERAHREGMECNGFAFEGSDTGGMDYALHRAIDFWYQDKEFWATLVRRIMDQDWSWNEPGRTYLDLYYAAKER